MTRLVGIVKEPVLAKVRDVSRPRNWPITSVRTRLPQRTSELEDPNCLNSGYERIIDRLGRRIGGVRGGSSSIVYGIGPAGRRLLAREESKVAGLGTPGDRYVAHTLAITELVVRLNEAALAGELDLIELATEPRCWRPFIGIMGARAMLKPDLFVRVGAGSLEDRWFIEVDLATESTTTIAAKAGVYLSHYRGGDEQARHGVYPRVIWTVPDRRRAEQISGALARLPRGTERLFAIWPYDEVIGRLSMEARA